MALKTLEMDDVKGADRHLTLMADVVAAYVSNNSLPLNDLPALMRSVHASLVDLEAGHPPPPPDEPKSPAVPIKKSITPDFLICLEDGKKFRSLKRHLGTVYKLTPEKYREKWGLPSDYPMVAPAYSAVRSQLAKAIGLGQTGRVDGEAPEAPPAEAAPTHQGATDQARSHRAETHEGNGHDARGHEARGHEAPTHGADGHEARAPRPKAVPKVIATEATEALRADGAKRRGRPRTRPVD